MARSPIIQSEVEKRGEEVSSLRPAQAPLQIQMGENERKINVYAATLGPKNSLTVYGSLQDR